MISRRSLFSFLAAAPVGAAAAVKAAAEPAAAVVSGYNMTAFEAYQRWQEAAAKQWLWLADLPDPKLQQDFDLQAYRREMIEDFCRSPFYVPAGG